MKQDCKHHLKHDFTHINLYKKYALNMYNSICQKATSNYVWVLAYK